MQTKTPKRPAPPPPLSLYTPPSNTNSTQISNPITTDLKPTVAVVDKKPSSSSNTTSILNRRRSASSSAPSPSPSTTTPKAEKKEKSLEKRFSVASLSGIFSSSSKKKGRNGKGVGEEKVPDVPVVPLNFRVVSTKEDGVRIVAGEMEEEEGRGVAV
ncbi:hypothetical protein BDY24DRAFT_391428 [Mrakia frigida]|uniref:Vac17p n=1 Tax=Mrakia frigida TaxID=29902 RepID=UPI003FCC01ED